MGIMLAAWITVSLCGSGQKKTRHQLRKRAWGIKMVNAYLRRRSISWCPSKPLLGICFLREVSGEAFMG